MVLYKLESRPTSFQVYCRQNNDLTPKLVWNFSYLGYSILAPGKPLWMDVRTESTLSISPPAFTASILPLPFKAVILYTFYLAAFNPLTLSSLFPFASVNFLLERQSIKLLLGIFRKLTFVKSFVASFLPTLFFLSRSDLLLDIHEK